MRLIGIFAGTLEGTAALATRITSRAPDSTTLSQLTEPTEQAPLAVLGTKTAYPAIECHRTDHDGFTIIDGEIYNLDRLGDGTQSSPKTPAATIGALLRQSGISGLGSVDAAASFSHYDPQTETLTLARDRIGNVPLFYLETSEALIWASDLPSLLPFIDAPEINPAALDFFMAGGYIPAPWTMVKGINRIAPAHAVTKRRGHASSHRLYYQPTGSPALSLSEDEIVHQLTDLFPKAVERRIDTLENTGILLSAGVDSKTVLAAAKHAMGTAPKSFTFNYVGHDGDLNEASEAKACADHLGSEHHVIQFHPETLPDLLPNIINDFGEPFSYGLHTAVLGEVKNFGVTDLLCGTGADGWFAGFQELNALKFMRQNPLLRLAIRSATSATLGVEQVMRMAGLQGRIRGVSDRAHRFHSGILTADRGLTFYLSDYIAPYWLRQQLYDDPSLAKRGHQEKHAMLDDVLRDLSGENMITRGKILSTRFYGADMMQNWNHWSARAIGATIRAPFYDLDLMDLITRLPLDRPGKPELRKYAAAMMPSDMAYTKKIAQSVPITDWFNGPLKGFVSDTFTSDAFRTGGVFAPQAAQAIWKNRPTYLTNIDWVFWNMIVLTQWQQQFGISAPSSSA